MKKNNHWFYGDNPSPQQRANRRAFRKWWRSFKREGELIIPFILGIMILGMVAMFAIHGAV